MRSFVLALLLTLAQPVAAETWIHVYGRSWHDQAGYREINTGVGIEQRSHLHGPGLRALSRTVKIGKA